LQSEDNNLSHLGCKVSPLKRIQKEVTKGEQRRKREGEWEKGGLK
jgi:hypothetical protein